MLTGLKLDQDTGQVNYSTAVRQTEDFSFIPSNSIQTGQLSEQRTIQLQEMLDEHPWAQRAVADPSEIVRSADGQQEYNGKTSDRYIAHIGNGPADACAYYDKIWESISWIVTERSKPVEREVRVA